MKQETLDILKNFSHINQSILLEADKPYIHTKAAAGHIYAYAPVEDTFPVDVPIYNLNSFLSTISLFENPEFVFEDGYVDIREENGRQSCQYRYSPKELIDHPSRVLTLDAEDIDFSFRVRRTDMQLLFKAAQAMQIKDVGIEFDGDKLFVKLYSVTNSGANNYFLEVDEYKGRPVGGKCVFSLDGLKLMDSGYTWSYAVDKGIVNLQGEDVSYYIAMYE